MRRDLAAEDGVVLAHAVLDVGVADAVHQRDAACALDRLRDGAARAHVVDDLAAALLPEDRLGEQGRDEVAGDEVARVVDEEAAVGVAVVGDPEVGVFRQRLADDELAVLGRSGFGSWFGNVPSGSKKQVTASIGSRSSTGGSITPAIPFAASITTFSGLIAATSTKESTFSTNPGQMSFGAPRRAAGG